MTAHAHSRSFAEVAALVARWHNRHPLARRIGPEHVQGIGIVALPFVDQTSRGAQPTAVEPHLDQPPAAAPAAGASLRERALAGAALGPEPTAALATPTSAKAPGRPAWKLLFRGLRRAFSEDFIAPISPSRAGTFADRHGAPEDPAAAAWPRRDVLIDTRRQLGSATVWRFLRTAAIEVDDKRQRVLIAADGSAAVIGPRLWSVPRCSAAVAVPLALALAAWIPNFMPGPTLQTPVLARAPLGQGASASSASAPNAPTRAASTVASQVAEAAKPILPIAPPVAAASLPRAAPKEADPMAPPKAAPELAATVPPQTRSDAPRVDIRPRLDPEVARAARRESSALRQASATSSNPPALAKAAKAAVVAAAASSADDGKTFALVARQTRTRAASEVLLGLMRSAAGTAPSAASRTEVLPSAEGFRASWWPFGSRGDAEVARQRLASVGLPVDLVEF